MAWNCKKCGQRYFREPLSYACCSDLFHLDYEVVDYPPTDYVLRFFDQNRAYPVSVEGGRMKVLVLKPRNALKLTSPPREKGERK